MPESYIFAPILLSIWHKSWTSGSLAAFSIIVLPSAYVAAIIKFSVAPRLGQFKLICVPYSLFLFPFIFALTIPSSIIISAPNAFSPLMCSSIGLEPILQPPGNGTLASPNLLNSAPMQKKLALVLWLVQMEVL